MYYIKLTITVFAVAGIGYGLTAFLITSFSNVGGTAQTIVGGFAVLFGLLLGPVVAIISGSHIGFNLKGDDATASTASIVGSAVGFLIMAVILILFASLMTSGGGGIGGTEASGSGSNFGPAIGATIGVAITGGATTFAIRKVQRMRTPTHSGAQMGR